MLVLCAIIVFGGTILGDSTAFGFGWWRRRNANVDASDRRRPAIAPPKTTHASDRDPSPAATALAVAARREIDSLWNATIQQYLEEPLSIYHRLWIEGAPAPPMRGKLLLFERTGLVLAVTNAGRANATWRTGEWHTVDVADVATRAGGAVPCGDGDGAAHAISIWVGVSGPELIAGIAEQERSGSNGGCLQHKWRFRFKILIPGRYTVVVKMLFLNGDASFDNAKCESNRTHDYVGGTVVDVVREDGKFYDTPGACCELCARDQRCRFWKASEGMWTHEPIQHPRVSVVVPNASVPGIEYRADGTMAMNTTLPGGRHHLPGIKDIKAFSSYPAWGKDDFVDSWCTLYASVDAVRRKPLEAKKAKGPRRQSRIGVSREEPTTTFLGCGWSFRPHMEICGVPAKGPRAGTLDIVHGGEFHVAVKAALPASPPPPPPVADAAALLAQHTRGGPSALPTCVTAPGARRLPPRGRWVRLDETVCDWHIWNQTLPQDGAFKGKGDLPLVHDTLGENGLCYFQTKLGALPWLYGREPGSTEYRTYSWMSPLLHDADIDGEGAEGRPHKHVCYPSRPQQCVRTVPLVYLPFDAAACRYPPLPAQPLPALHRCFQKRRIGVVTLGGASLTRAFTPYIRDFFRGVAAAAKQAGGTEPTAATDGGAVQVVPGSSILKACSDDLLTKARTRGFGVFLNKGVAKDITKVTSTGHKYYAHVDSFGSPHLLWHDTIDNIKARFEAHAECYNQIAALVDEIKKNRTAGENFIDRPPLLFYLNVPAVTSEREPHITMERGRAFNAVARAALAPLGWIEVDFRGLSMGLTFDSAGQHDGMHMLGVPMKAAARVIAGAMCDEPESGLWPGGGGSDDPSERRNDQGVQVANINERTKEYFQKKYG